jgi:hypothetical protein
MPREGDRLIFRAAFVVLILHDGWPKASLSDYNPPRKTAPPFHSSLPSRAARGHHVDRELLQEKELVACPLPCEQARTPMILVFKGCRITATEVSGSSSENVSSAMQIASVPFIFDAIEVPSPVARRVLTARRLNGNGTRRA